jgi:N-acetylglucosamine-6-phosphate deacetylase
MAVAGGCAREGGLGTLRPGGPADVVVLEEDLVVRATLGGGAAAYP